ncbi:MAG TPA: cupin domain-containing protein [Acidimicrobiales bacterium]|nr:cupin domain-containing protein [Acidimicrobiales bacterium]
MRELQSSTDGFSWRHPLVEPLAADDRFRHFALQAMDRGEGKVARSPLVRGERLAVYVQACQEGQGENFLHQHGDEAAWLVLEGEAVFSGEDGQEIAVVRGGEGIALRPGTPYRYECRGPMTVMVRTAARLDDAEAPAATRAATALAPTA